MDEEENKKIHARMFEIETELKQLDGSIPNYVKSSRIFGLIAKGLIIITVGLFLMMQSIGERKAFLTLFVLSVAAVAASMSDGNMAKSQQAKKNTLLDEYFELEAMLPQELE